MGRGYLFEMDEKVTNLFSSSEDAFFDYTNFEFDYIEDSQNPAGMILYQRFGMIFLAQC